MMCLTCQVRAPRVGSVELSMSPIPVPARHSCGAVHEILRTALGMPMVFHDPWLPPGFVVTAIVRDPGLAAMHSCAEAHDSIDRPEIPGCVVVHAEAPPPGLVEVRTSPPLPIATQNETDGQETAATGAVECGRADGPASDCQALAPAAGLVETNSPSTVPAAQRSAEGHAIEKI